MRLHVNLFDPPTTNPFLGSGNIYNRPQREVSLWLAGRERFNKLSPTPLRITGKPIPLALTIQNVTGGANVTFMARSVPVYNHRFVPLLHVDATAKPKFEGDAIVTGTQFFPHGPFDFAPPVHIKAIEKALNDQSHRDITAMVEFPENIDDVGRVICTLTLGPTPKGIDPWDRLAHIYVFDGHGHKFELLRYITPYRKGWQWNADVTDLLPLLHGRRKLMVQCQTYSVGWLVSVSFDFFNGPIVHRPIWVHTLWDKTVILGQAKMPIDGQLPPATINPHGRGIEHVGWVKLRTLVTGHGMSPNTDNAGEFCPLWRKLWVNDHDYQNLLWKTNNYLNPCSPQSGTWKYDRAGWGPGTVVKPWTVGFKPTGQPIEVRYEIQSYVNRTPDKGYPAQQCVCVQEIDCR